MPVVYVFLLMAVVAETVGTTALQASQQFTRFWPSVLVVLGYGAAFWFLSLTLRELPVGITYAIWSGLGIIFISVIGFALFGQRLDTPALIGLALIITGIVVIQVFSNTTGH